MKGKDKRKDGDGPVEARQRRTIDLAVLRKNVRLIRDSLPTGARLMAVVKADGYGHGIVQVAQSAVRAGAEALAVALIGEGVLLRQAGVTVPVLVLGASMPEELPEGVRHGLTMAVCTPEAVYQAQEAAASVNGEALVHLKLDTGMNRIGARSEDEVRAVIAALRECPRVRLTGVFTHFADADGSDMAFTRLQLERFNRLSSLLPERVIRHCANSAAIHRLPEAAFDMVRAGISLYGYPPVETALPLEPCMRWTARVAHVKAIDPGDTVSYGRTYTADRTLRVATVSCGYGDGYHRAASGKAEVIIRGRRAPVIGRICMDQMMADVSDIPDVKTGDEVVLIGRDGEAVITAEDVASWAGTISYEVLLAATGRVPRVWLHESDG
ncbi:MAG: alanine racemase [Christensenellaceae bacterium]|nr:alanine racemase [Christensenellaceae bacterium]